MTAVKKVATVIVLVAAGGFAYVHLRGPQGIPALLDKREAIRKLGAEIDQLRADNQRRRDRLRELATDEGIEAAIRERTGKIRANEKRLEFPPEEAKAE